MNNKKVEIFFDSLSKQVSKAEPHSEMALQFMEKTIEKINYCLASLYATQSLMIKKGIIKKDELLSELREARALPATQRGHEMLEKILDEYDAEKLLNMVELPKDNGQSTGSDKTENE